MLKKIFYLQAIIKQRKINNKKCMEKSRSYFLNAVLLMLHDEVAAM